MTEESARKSNSSRKILLVVAASLVTAVPAAAGLLYAGLGHAQSSGKNASVDPIHFEVASIKQDMSNSKRMVVNYLGNGVTFTGAPVALLVQMAFGVEGDQIAGLPAWAKTDRYDIDAKVDDADVPRWKSLTLKQSEPTLQALLARRFDFKAHSEMRERQVYSLVVAKGGPKFHVATPGDTYRDGLKNVDGSPRGAGAAAVESGRFTVQGGRIAALVKTLSMWGLGYPIEDRTGLTGVYDMTLLWAPGESGSPDDLNSSLFTALEEQLGLKLELKKEPIESLVVDHIERPSAN
jgi:uncharacterized protein (TIGR03435 family)